MRTTLPAILAIGLLGSPALADLPFEKYQALKQSSNQVDRAAYVSYLSGVADSYTVVAANPQGSRFFCAPNFEVSHETIDQAIQPARESQQYQSALRQGDQNQKAMLNQVSVMAFCGLRMMFPC